MNADPSLPNDQRFGAPHHDPPNPPPAANKLQLELWRRVESYRCQQIQTLSPSNFQLYVDVISLDLETSRFKDDIGGRKNDLARGHYSSHLLHQHPSPSDVTVQDVEHNMIALFYRSIDGRLSPNSRKHGLDALKRSFLALDASLKAQALNSSNIHTIENQAQEQSRTGLPLNSIAASTQNSDSMNNNCAPPHPNNAMGNQTQHSRNNQRHQQAHDFGCGTEWGENDPQNKRQRAPGSNRDATRERDFSDCAYDSVDPSNHYNKRSRKEASPNMDGDGASEKLSQLRNTQENQKESRGANYKEGREKESNGERQRKEASLPANTNNILEDRRHSGVDSDSGIVATHPAPSDSIYGNRQNLGAVDSSSSIDNKGTAGTLKALSSSQASSAILSHTGTSLATTTLPPPVTHQSVRSITFLPDNHCPALASASLKPRDSCTLSYDAGFNLNGSGSCLDEKAFTDVRERLERWDPYWKIVQEFGRQDVRAAGSRRKTKASTRTTACVSAFYELSKNNVENVPTSCTMVTVDLPSECIRAQLSNTDASSHAASDNPWGLKWGEQTTTYKTGDRRLLLRMLPLKRSDKEKKRSDTHLWPIGTFLQISRGTQQQVLHLFQRQQQSHDPKLWKGMCHPLDMTTILPDANFPFSLEICTNEVIEKVDTAKYKVGAPVIKKFEGNDGKMRPFCGTVNRYDDKYKLYQVVYEDGDAEELTGEEVATILVNGADKEEEKLLQGSFAVHLAVCEYVEPSDLSNQLIGKMQKISLETSQKMAMQYLKNNVVSIDIDCESSNASGSSSLTFSLICPISKTAIKTPVRGQHCKHMQCFDLETWLHSNKHVSGGRWRCGVCESFVAAGDLVRCGLFDAMLHDHRDKVSGVRDKVSFKSDGSWRMKEENKLRYTSKNCGVKDDVNGISAENQETNDASQRRSVSEPEVIELL